MTEITQCAEGDESLPDARPVGSEGETEGETVRGGSEVRSWEGGPRPQGLTVTLAKRIARWTRSNNKEQSEQRDPLDTSG